MWMGSDVYDLAAALKTLILQLEAEYPGKQWQNSPQTGTIGDTRHLEEGYQSDHNPWLNKTVRAFDCAANVSGVPGIINVSDAPDVEALFQMFNKMYGEHDSRVWPDGYAIFHHRITDWNNPGGYRATTPDEDPHLYHLHFSVSRTMSGYNSTLPWPIGSVVVNEGEFDMDESTLRTILREEHQRIQLAILNASPNGGYSPAVVKTMVGGAGVLSRINGSAPIAVRFPNFRNSAVPQAQQAIYLWNGTYLTWLTSQDWALVKNYVRFINVSDHLHSNIFKCPITPGTPDPRKG